MGVLAARIVYVSLARPLLVEERKRGLDHLNLELQMVESPYECWECPLQDQTVLLTAEMCLQPKIYLSYFICVSVLPACVCAHYVHNWYPQESEEDAGSPQGN